MNNYKVIVEFGNGKSDIFKCARLAGIFDRAKQLAQDKKTTYLQAKVFPLTKIGKIVVFKDALIIDPLGKYSYYHKGEKLALAR